MPPEGEKALLVIRNVRKNYVCKAGPGRRRSIVSAIDDVSLTVHTGGALAIVGESGAGKSTLARCMAGLELPTSGEIVFDGHDVVRSDRRERLSIRRRLQLIFQDAAAALNPRFTAAEIIAEPLHIQRIGSRDERRVRALQMMERVGLLPQWADRRPMQFSGGQRRRLAIARALVLEPSLLILDEALAGLDLSVQAQIMNLLLELQSALKITYVYILHDLRAAAFLADEVAVMLGGRVVERGVAWQIFSSPQHPYTKTLLASRSCE